MTQYIEVIPTYGRDYKSAKDLKADWAAGKDFIIVTFGPNDGRYINKADSTGLKIIARYRKLTQTVML